MTDRTFTMSIPFDGDVFADEALTKMIGQRPVLTLAFDRSRTYGHAEVTEARFTDGLLHLTMRGPEEHVARWERDSGVIAGDTDDDLKVSLAPVDSCGFIIKDATVDEEAEHRTFDHVVMAEVTKVAKPTIPERAQ